MKLIYWKQRWAVVLFSLLAFCVLMLASCDEHEPLDLDIHAGYILCADGSVVSDAVFNPSDHRAVAVVFAEKTSQHPVLAVLLDEIGPVAFADTLSFDQKTSCSIDSCDGYSNTVALQTTNIQRKVLVDSSYIANPLNYYKSPLGLMAFRSHWFNQSDYIPSVYEMGLLKRSLVRVNPVLDMLGGTPVGTTEDGAACWYWTSTEVSENKMNQAWLFSAAADGSCHKAPKTNRYRARLIVEYNPLNVKQ